MTTLRVLVVAAFIGAAAIVITVAQAPQGTQSQGALQQRPGADRQPEFPIPNIREYKPHSTLVVPQHPVPRAKFPVVDIHSHQPSPISEAQMETLVKSMDPLNLQLQQRYWTIKQRGAKPTPPPDNSPKGHDVPGLRRRRS